jgi:hypothetical protein
MVITTSFHTRYAAPSEAIILGGSDRACMRTTELLTSLDVMS